LQQLEDNTIYIYVQGTLKKCLALEDLTKVIITENYPCLGIIYYHFLERKKRYGIKF